MIVSGFCREIRHKTTHDHGNRRENKARNVRGMTFAELHYRDVPLLLPNAWDVASALAFVAAGYEAIGTTSFGVASSIGRPDGRRATREANIALARALTTLPVYITLDIEDGYTDDPDAVADYVAALGVAGINIEDSGDARLIPPDRHAAKVA